MKTGKYLAIAVLILLTIQLQAQELGIQAGFLQSMERGKTGSTSKYEGTDTLNGFKVGLVYEPTLWKGLGIATGLNYSFLTQQGKWSKKDAMGWQNKIHSTAHYLSIPLHLQYKFRIAKDTYITPFAGPEFSYCLSYQTTSNKRNITLNKEETTTENYYTKDEDTDGITDFSPFNIQLSVGLAFQYKHYLIKGGYDFGIRNLNKDGYDNRSSKNWYNKRNEWNIRLVYLF